MNKWNSIPSRVVLLPSVGAGGGGDASFFYPVNTSGSLRGDKVFLVFLRSPSISQISSLICIPYKPSRSGKSRVTDSGFGPLIKKIVAPIKGGPLKIFTLNPKDWLSVAEWLRLSLKGLNCIIGIWRYYRGGLTQSQQRPPSRPLGPGNL